MLKRFTPYGRTFTPPLKRPPGCCLHLVALPHNRMAIDYDRQEDGPPSIPPFIAICQLGEQQADDDPRPCRYLAWLRPSEEARVSVPICLAWEAVWSEARRVATLAMQDIVDLSTTVA